MVKHEPALAGDRTPDLWHDYEIAGPDFCADALLPIAWRKRLLDGRWAKSLAADVLQTVAKSKREYPYSHAGDVLCFVFRHSSNYFHL